VETETMGKDGEEKRTRNPAVRTHLKKQDPPKCSWMSCDERCNLLDPGERPARLPVPIWTESRATSFGFEAISCVRRKFKCWECNQSQSGEGNRQIQGPAGRIARTISRHETRKDLSGTDEVNIH